MPYVKCDNCNGVSHMSFADPEKNLTTKTVPVCTKCYNTPKGRAILTYETLMKQEKLHATLLGWDNEA